MRRQFKLIALTLMMLAALCWSGVAGDGEVAAKSEGDDGSGEAKGRHLGLAPVLGGLLGPSVYGYGGYPPYGAAYGAFPPYGPYGGYRPHHHFGYNNVFPGVYPPFQTHPNFGGYGFYG